MMAQRALDQDRLCQGSPGTAEAAARAGKRMGGRTEGSETNAKWPDIIAVHRIIAEKGAPLHIRRAGTILTPSNTNHSERSEQSPRGYL